MIILDKCDLRTNRVTLKTRVPESRLPRAREDAHNGLGSGHLVCINKIDAAIRMQNDLERIFTKIKLIVIEEFWDFKPCHSNRATRLVNKNIALRFRIEIGEKRRNPWSACQKRVQIGRIGISFCKGDIAVGIDEETVVHLARKRKLEVVKVVLNRIVIFKR